jgi:lipopolysaccharide transport system ATP-binding protein
MKRPALEVRGVSKRYRLYAKESDRLKELIFKKKYHKEFYANRDVDFTLYRGETLGIVGVNGAGKSTLLKIIAGVIEPTRGEVVRHGRVTALLELGTGFNPELTGRENVYFNGMLVGMERSEIERRFDEIVEFSELGGFIDEPLKTYSSGMMMRLAFSIAIHSEPSILIVDEALSVGDAHFSAKCTDALRRLKERELSIIYVSHDLNSLKILCDRMLLLDRGSVVERGDPESVVERYNSLIARLDDQERIYSTEERVEGYGTREAEITGVRLGSGAREAALFAAGQRGWIEVEVSAHERIEEVGVGILIRDRYGQDIFGTNSWHHGKSLNIEPNGRYRYRFDLAFDLGPGSYTLTVALHTGDSHVERCLHWKDRAAEFEIAGIRGEHFVGICRLGVEVSSDSLSIDRNEKVNEA